RRHERLEPFLRSVAVNGAIEVVRIEYVDTVGAEALEREFERAHHSVMAVVVELAPRRRVEEFPDSRALARRHRLEQASALGRQHVVVALPAAQEGVEAGLRQAEPIERSRVEIADPGLPRGFQDGLRLVVADRAVEIAERRGAETQRGEAQPPFAGAAPL